MLANSFLAENVPQGAVRIIQRFDQRPDEIIENKEIFKMETIIKLCLCKWAVQ